MVVLFCALLRGEHGKLLILVCVLGLVGCGISLYSLFRRIVHAPGQRVQPPGPAADEIWTNPLIAAFFAGLLLVGFVLFILPERAPWPVKLIPVVPVVLYIAWRIQSERRDRVCRDRLSHGCCPRCGYDLRASPNRCPECGAIGDGTAR